MAQADPAVANPGLIRLEAVQFDPLIDGTPDLSARLPQARPLRPARTAGSVYYLIQFSEPITATHHRRIGDLGVEVLAAVPNRTLLVRLPAAASEHSLLSIPGARYVASFQPAYKIATSVTRALEAHAGTEIPVPLDVTLFPGEDVDAVVGAVRARFPAVDLVYVKRTPPLRITLHPSGGELGSVVGALARDPAVQFVERRYPFEVHNDNAVWIVQSYDRINGPGEALGPVPRSYSASAGIWNRGLTGAGQIIAVADTGLDHETSFFFDPAVPTIPQSVAPPGSLTLQPSHRKVLALNAPIASSLATVDSFRHGSHVAGSAAGDDLAHLALDLPVWHDNADGIAPAAKIVFQDVSGNVDSACSTSIVVNSIQEMLAQSYDAGARIATNSWGLGSAGGYNSSTSGVDHAVWDREDLLVFFSAGRYSGGAIGGVAACKNCVTVGASENWDADFLDVFGMLDPENMTAFSNRGPTSDGRMKPDLVAPGYVVYSTRFPTVYFSNAGDPACSAPGAEVCFPGFGGCYVTDTSDPCPIGPLSGTSMATPIAAGLGALARQYFVEGFYPSGQSNPANTVSPTAALLKALLINSARTMTGNLYERRGTPLDLGPLDDAPSMVQGWGRVALDDALYFTGEARRLIVVDVPRASGLSTGEVHETSFSVSDPAQPLKITLAWSDAPGPLFVGSLINNLDLELVAPDGTVYRGNQWGVDLPSVPDDKQSLPNAGGTDLLNNVEGVLVQTPLPGSYLVRVLGTKVPGDAGILTQGFGLVVTGGVTQGTAGTVAPVPDGSFGEPMRAERIPDGSIDINWDVASCPSSDYHLLHGPLSGVSTWQLDGAQCDLGAAGSFLWTGVPEGDTWFLVVGNDDVQTEGPWGDRTGGVPRNGASPSGLCALPIRENAVTCP